MPVPYRLFNKNIVSAKSAIFLLLLGPSTPQAVTLSEAVNAQLETVSLPCDRLLGTDTITVLTGELADICSRAVPFGSTPQNTAGSGANLSSLSSSTTEMMGREEREEVQIGPRWTLFFTGESEVLNRDSTYSEDGFDSNAARLLAGASYAMNPRTNLGLAINLQKHDGEYNHGGDFKADSKGARALASHYFSEQLFIQAVAGYDSVSSQRSRPALFEEYFNGGLVFSREGKPDSDFNYGQTEFSLLAGYNMALGKVTLTPQLGVTRLDIDYGTYSETGNSGLELTFHDDQFKSLQSKLGVQTTLAISTGFGVVLPQLDINWIKEYENESRRVNVSFTQDTRAKQFYYDTEALDDSFFEVGLGAVFVLPGGNQIFIWGQSLLGHELYDSYVLSAGLSIEL